MLVSRRVTTDTAGAALARALDSERTRNARRFNWLRLAGVSIALVVDAGFEHARQSHIGIGPWIGGGWLTVAVVATVLGLRSDQRARRWPIFASRGTSARAPQTHASTE